MPLVGPFDPAGYVAGDFATYPPLPDGVEFYQPNMWWDSTGVGVMDDQPVAVGDRIYAVGRPRRYGEFTYGDLLYGNPPDRDWPPALVAWLVWDSTPPPEAQVPFPNAGCPFGETGQFGPGQWRIVVDAFFNDRADSRTYGSLSYGDEVYGDDEGEGLARWHDITRPQFSVLVVTGTDDGRPVVPVDTIEIELIDDDGIWFDFAEPAFWFQAFVGSAVRVGFFDPEFRYHPIIVGTIEQISDVHDTRPRTLTVQGFGNVMDLASDVFGWQRPAEKASTRFGALMAAGHWRFDDGTVDYPWPDADLHADPQPSDITVRQEVDRTALSAGWLFDTDPMGFPRLRTWPLTPTGVPLHVYDCPRADDPPDAVTALRILFVADENELLNIAMISNNDSPTQLSVRAEDSLSIGRFGRRDKAMGFPMSGLAFASETAARTLVTRYAERWAFVVRRVENFDLDTALDPGWLAHAVDLDTGRAVHVERREVNALTLDAVVVGYRHLIEPGRMRSTVSTATTTETL